MIRMLKPVKAHSIAEILLGEQILVLGKVIFSMWSDAGSVKFDSPWDQGIFYFNHIYNPITNFFQLLFFPFYLKYYY